jgi:hypothetical protein
MKNKNNIRRIVKRYKQQNYHTRETIKQFKETTPSI